MVVVTSAATVTSAAVTGATDIATFRVATTESAAIMTKTPTTKRDTPEQQIAQAGAAVFAGASDTRVQGKVSKKGNYHDMGQYKNSWLPGAWSAGAWAFDAWLPGAWS